MDRTGFIGVGNMGGAMALRLLDAGFPLTVCDPSPAAVAAMVQRGAQVAASPKEVADRAEIVFASLPSQEISKDVALGKTGIATGSAIKVYVEMSTLGTKMVQSIADGLLPSGIGLIESPVSGGPLGAKAGTLTAIPCGARTAYERALPALKAIAPNLFYLGDKPGQAIGLNGVFGNVGVAMAPMLTAFIATQFGWHWAFILPGAACTILGVGCGA